VPEKARVVSQFSGNSKKEFTMARVFMALRDVFLFPALLVIGFFVAIIVLMSNSEKECLRWQEFIWR
jgi:hypothetical protein